MRDIWAVKTDAERAQWAFTPLASVGPLRFGMSHAEVAAALGGAPPICTLDSQYHSRRVMQACFQTGPFGTYVTTYYENFQTETAVLAGVAVDALRGPQVTFNGVALTGRVPSVLEEWVIDYADANGLEVALSGEGDLGLTELGLIPRAQRAGDVVLTRPLLLCREWMDNDEAVPRAEWHTH